MSVDSIFNPRMANSTIIPTELSDDVKALKLYTCVIFTTVQLSFPECVCGIKNNTVLATGEQSSKANKSVKGAGRQALEKQKQAGCECRTAVIWDGRQRSERFPCLRTMTIIKWNNNLAT